MEHVELGYPGEPLKLIELGPLPRISIGHPGQMEQVTALFDTGADACFIREDLSKKLALPKVGDGYFHSLHKRFESDVVRGRVQVGSVIDRRWIFRTTPMLDKRFDVVLGRDLFWKFVLRYDGPTGSLRLWEPVAVD